MRTTLAAATAAALLVGCTTDEDPSNTSQQRIESVDGHDMAFLEANPNVDRTLVLLHGIPTSSYLYRDVVPELAEATGWHVVAVDLLGFGASAKPSDGQYSVQAHAERTFGLADALGLDGFVLGVHDIGGFVGWEMLAQNPSRLDGLVVANTTAYAAGLTPAPTTMQIMSGAATPREVWEQLDDPAFARATVREFFEIGLADPADATDDLVETYAEPLTTGSSEAFVQFFEGVGPLASEPERRERFARFPGPVTVIHGTEDRFFDVDVVPGLFQEDFGLTNDAVVRVPGAGHYVQEDAPDAYIDAVARFLSTLD